MTHVHNCIPIKVRRKRRWICIKCNYHFAEDVTGWHQSDITAWFAVDRRNPPEPYPVALGMVLLPWWRLW